jgi:hypothetical protein
MFINFHVPCSSAKSSGTITVTFQKCWIHFKTFCRQFAALASKYRFHFVRNVFRNILKNVGEIVDLWFMHYFNCCWSQLINSINNASNNRLWNRPGNNSQFTGIRPKASLTISPTPLNQNHGNVNSISANVTRQWRHRFLPTATVMTTEDHFITLIRW